MEHAAIAYLLDIEGVPDLQLTALLPQLSESERQRFQRIARTERKRQFLSGRLLLRYALVELLQIGLSRIDLTERDRQAPILTIDSGMTPPFFSIAHTGHWIACACSKSSALGIDIERIDTRRDWQAIAEHTFGPKDSAWIQQQPDRVTAFYRLWSKKEARFKLTQGYEIAEIEHVYEHAHPAMTVALMSAQPLRRAPQFLTIDWGRLRDMFADGVKGVR